MKSFILYRRSRHADLPRRHFQNFLLVLNHNSRNTLQNA
jgi:hypothetical protein